MTRPIACHQGGAPRQGRHGLLYTTALQAAAVIVLAGPARAVPPASTQPQNGRVVAGSATIAQTQSTTTVTQTTQRAAVNWQSFNVGSAQTVNFNQPSTSAVTLNRVTGPDPSQIAGHINANGQVVLVNQSGVVFTQGAQVNAQGLVVSSADISNPNFMSGTMKFDRPGSPNATITNQGTISLKQRGLAALVAPAVANAGVIQAPLGTVVLAGAVTHTIDLYGDGLMSIDVSSSVKQTPIGRDGKKVTTLVNNSGTILAEGGTVLLTAAAADGIVQNLVTTTGRIAANTARNGQTGTIAIHGVGGSLLIEGDISAAGRAPGTTGGSIELTATKAVTVAAGARISASGKGAGGTVAVGTTLVRARGGAAVAGVATAATTTVAPGAKISANATQHGNGGNVTVLSTANTNMQGAVSARGGKSGGNGGTAEISGATGLAFTGTVNVSAPAGTLGSVLFDPGNLTISAPAPAASGAAPGGTEGAILSSTVLAQSVTGDITVSATGDLTINAPMILTGTNQALSITVGQSLVVGQTASISAPGNVVITSGASVSTGGLHIFDRVTSTGGSVSITSGTSGDLFIAEPVTGYSSVALTAGSGGLTIGVLGGASAVVAGSTVALRSAGTIDMRGTVLSAGTVGLTAQGDIVNSGTLVAGTLTGSSATGGAVLGGNSAVGALSDFTTQTGFQLANTQSLSVTGTLASRTASVTIDVGGAALSVPGAIKAQTGVGLSGGVVDVPGSIGGASVTIVATLGTIGLPGTVSTAGVASVTSYAGITETGHVNAGTLTGGSATGQALLTGTNAIATLSDFTTQADFRLTNTQSLSVAGAVTSNAGNVAIDVGGAGLQIPGAVTASQAVTLNASSLGIGGAIAGNTVTLTTMGDMTETGAVTAATLTGGSVNGQAALTGPNMVATLSDFTTQDDFRLRDARALAVTGTVASATGSIVIDAGPSALTLPGRLTAPLAASLSGGTVDIAGYVSGGAISISAVNGTIGLAGTVAGSGGVNLSASGGIAETGKLNTVTLTGNSATGQALLTGTNVIATLAGFTTQTDFRLINGRALSVTGPVTSVAGNVMIDTGSNFLAVPGTVTAPQTVTLHGGSLDLSGRVNGRTVTIAASGDISENGMLTAGTLAGGSANGQALLTGTNAVGVLSDFATQGDFILKDGRALSVAGTVTSTAGNIGLDTGAFALAIAGAVTTPQALTLNAGGIDVSGSVSANPVTMTSLGSITLPGTVSTAGAVDLMASGDITENGILTASMLSGSAGGFADFSGATTTSNMVAWLGNFAAPSSLTLLDGMGLQLASATVSAATIRISAADLAVSGNTELMTTGPGFTRPAVGTAPQDPYTASVASGFAGSVGAYAYGGAYLESAQSFTQAGKLVVASSTSAAPLLSISLVGGGSGVVAFDASSVAGLQAPSTPLLLHLGAGSATGSVNINTLQLFYSGGTALPTTLRGTLRTTAGTVAGGPFAASQAGIGQQSSIYGLAAFVPNSKYQLNGCEIAAISCVNTLRLLPPVLDPLKDIKLGIIRETDDETILLLPDITDLSY